MQQRQFTYFDILPPLKNSFALLKLYDPNPIEVMVEMRCCFEGNLDDYEVPC